MSLFILQTWQKFGKTVGGVLINVPTSMDKAKHIYIYIFRILSHPYKLQPS